MTWTLRIKPLLKKAVEEKNIPAIATNLRLAAKEAYQNGEKALAVQLIEIALNFAEGSNQYILGLLDWRYYTTGQKVSMEQINFIGPDICPELPWEKLKKIINNFS
jgi:hypothetical protein